MYPVYPWGLYGVGRPELALARDTFRLGADNADQHGVVGWKQDPIFAARLGLTDQAVAMVSEKLDDAPRRFPSFWGPGFDWTPDFNHGGSGSIALQEMLMQTPGDAIHLFAAWPLDWDVTFRLHGPQETVVEAALVAGELTELRAAPARRLDEWSCHRCRHRRAILRARASRQPRKRPDELSSLVLDGDPRLGLRPPRRSSRAGHRLAVIRTSSVHGPWEKRILWEGPVSVCSAWARPPRRGTPTSRTSATSPPGC